MRSRYGDVRDFHAKMGIGYGGDPRPLPGEGPDRSALELMRAARDHLRRRVRGDASDLSSNRVAFLLEELIEYVEAGAAGDLAGQLDALIDLEYVALGTAVLHGFDAYEEAFDAVHAANLRKEPRGSDASKLGVTKPPGWVPPDLSAFVAPTAARVAPDDVTELEVLPGGRTVTLDAETFEVYEPPEADAGDPGDEDDGPSPTRRGFFNFDR